MDERSLTPQQPFFLSTAPLAPHVEVIDLLGSISSNDPMRVFESRIRPAPRHEHLIDGDLASGEMPELVATVAFNEADMSDKPKCAQPLPSQGISFQAVPVCIGDRPELEPEDLAAVSDQWKSMLASMIAFDELVRDVVASLRAHGLLENTVIIFTSDNGWLAGEHRASGKELAYYESTRVPLVIRAPGTTGGLVAHQLVLNNDLAPTIAAFAGATPALDVDGASLVPIVFDPGVEWFRKRFSCRALVRPEPAQIPVSFLFGNS